MERRINQGLMAGVLAAGVSGLPSTVHAVVTGRPLLEATRAAGSIVLPQSRGGASLVGAAVPVHLTLSLGWGVVLSHVLPRRATTLWGAVAGVGIAALDLGVLGRRLERISALPLGPQVADHVAFGAIVGAVLSRMRTSRSP